jgi:regulatory protein
VARVVSFEKGALGTVKAVTDEGSFFIFKPAYLESAFLAEGLEAPPAAPADVPDAVLDWAALATLAESRALSLLARAEQYRAGLERKLSARGFPRSAVKAALDALEAEALLSDARYAESWIRQRLRSRIEGPRSLAASLAGKGVERQAVREAVARTLGADERAAFLVKAIATLMGDGRSSNEARGVLLDLGWRTGEVDEALDASVS